LNPIAKVVVGVANATFEVCLLAAGIPEEAEITLDGSALERAKQV